MCCFSVILQMVKIFRKICLKLFESDVEFLEKSIDMMDHELPNLTSFIFPGGMLHPLNAHVARTVCRRAERIIS